MLISRYRDGRADFEEALSAVSPQVQAAARQGVAVLQQLGIDFAVIGGLAVGAHGVPRATKDADFLVGPGVFEHHASGVVTFRAAVPVAVGRVAIDYLEATDPVLQQALRDAEGTVPVVPVEALVAMKLRANRPQDRTDVYRLVNEAGVDDRVLTRWLGQREPELLPRLRRALEP